MKLRTIMILGVAALLALLLAVPVAAQQAITVPLNAVNNSGESGTATLTAQGNQTKVAIDLHGAPAAAQAAHIHEASCATVTPGTPALYELSEVMGGKSETMINASLASLLTGKLAIAIHRTTSEASTHAACGDIPSAGTAAPMAPMMGHPMMGHP